MKRVILIASLGVLLITSYFCNPLNLAQEALGLKQRYCVHYYSLHSAGSLQNCTAEKSEQGKKSCLLAAADPAVMFNYLGIDISEGSCPYRNGPDTYSPNIWRHLRAIGNPAEVNAAITREFCVNPGSQNGHHRTNCYTMANGHGAEDCVPLADALGSGDTVGSFGTVPILAGACSTRPDDKPLDSFLANPTAVTNGEPRRQFCVRYADGRCGYCFIANRGGEGLTGADCVAAATAGVDRVEEGECTLVNGCSSDDSRPALQLPPPGRWQSNAYCLRYAGGECTSCFTNLDSVGARECMAFAPGAVRADTGPCPSPHRVDGGCTSQKDIRLPPNGEIDAYGRWRKAPHPSFQ